jgi:regulator of sirC expression with transglutaminase-like and TPR domain
MDPAERFASLINDPSSGASLGLLVALIGSAFDRRSETDDVLEELDELGTRFDPTFGAIMAGLFGSGLLRGSTADYGDPRNSFLHEVLGRRQGLPISLSVIAIEVGVRAGVPIVGVGLPGHFVVADVQSGRFADPFYGGQIYERDRISDAWRQITASRTPLDPAMLMPTPTRAIVLRVLNNLRATLEQRRDEARLPILARLRGAFPELRREGRDHQRWLSTWN